jgi:hypothetical protein
MLACWALAVPAIANKAKATLVATVIFIFMFSRMRGHRALRWA